MDESSLFPFELPAVARKKITFAFDGGRLSSNGGVLLLREAERIHGIAMLLAGCMKDRRDQRRIDHTLVEMLKTRMFAIAAGYEDADDCDSLRDDPILKMAVGRAPESGHSLCSQPTMPRLENAPGRIEVVRMMAAMVDLFCQSYRSPPSSITLDIDDTVDAVHGRQQLSLFHAHYDTRCFLPIHIYEANSEKPLAVILRAGKSPTGVEVRTIIKHVVLRIRRSWPKVHILFRGDGHYARPEVMAWCEANGVDYIFGLAGNEVLTSEARPAADDLCTQHAEMGTDRMRGWCAFDYAAKSWKVKRRVIGRIEATGKGLDMRFVVTSLKGAPEWLYQSIYCARGQAENLIKMHKSQLASDRTSCESPIANQFRLILHTSAYWLLWQLRSAVPKACEWARAEFATLRLKVIKIAARVIEKATRIRVALPAACVNGGGKMCCWYDPYQTFGPDGLEDRRSGPGRVWNRIPDEVREQIVDLALNEPELSPRELAVTFTDTRNYFVSKASIYRLLKAH